MKRTPGNVSSVNIVYGLKSVGPLTILARYEACNSFQNPTKSLSAQWSIDVKSAVTFHFLHVWSIEKKVLLLDFEKIVY